MRIYETSNKIQINKIIIGGEEAFAFDNYNDWTVTKVIYDEKIKYGNDLKQIGIILERKDGNHGRIQD